MINSSDLTTDSYNEPKLPNNITVDNNQNNDRISEPKNFLPNKRGFKLAVLNITSLIKHLDELRVLLVNSPVDVLAINDTIMRCMSIGMKYSVVIEM